MDEVLGFDFKTSALEGELIDFRGGASQKKTLCDYININELGKALDYIRKFTGVAICILDEADRIVFSSADDDARLELHKVSARASALRKLNPEDPGEPAPQKIPVNKRPNGLWDVFIPIKNEEDILGSLLLGVFEPSEDAARESEFSDELNSDEPNRASKLAVQNIPEIAELCSGLVQKYVYQGRQIERQKQIEKALRNHAAQFVDMFNNNSVIMYLIDAETFEIIDANLAAESYYGYTSRELQGMTLFDLTMNAEDEVLKNVVRAVSGRQLQFFAMHKRKDGSIRDVDLRSTILTMQNGKRAIFIIVNDITELKEAQSNLLASESKYRTLTNQLPVGVYRVTLEGKLIFVNDALARILGYDDANELLQFRSSEIFFDPADRERFLQQIISTQKPLSFEYKLVTKLGKVIYVRDTVQHIICENSTEEYLDGVLEDITERKLAAEKLERMNEELESAVLERTAQLEEALEELTFENYERKRTADELLRTKEELDEAFAREKELSDMKTRLISMVSHEYRTPLTVILSATYLLDKFFKMNDEKNFEHHISLIQTSVKNMTQLINEALKVEKIESDEISSTIRSVDMAKLTSYIVQEVSSQSGIMHKLSFSNKSINSFAPTDEKLIYTVINNVLSNSIKYSPRDSRIDVELSDTAGEVILTITDQGVGIPQGELKQVFEPFYKASNVRMSSGTGLGLSVVKRYCDILRADIEIDSAPGEGTKVEVKFPRSPEKNEG